MKNVSYRRLGILSSALVLSFGVSAAASDIDRSQLQLSDTQPNKAVAKAKELYIVQMKGESAIRHSVNLDNIPKRVSANAISINYNAQSSSAQTYLAQLTAKRNSLIAATGIAQPLHTYGHTFNGFSVKLSAKQVEVLKASPDVLNVWREEAMQMDTTNTPLFLGLTEAGGLHMSGLQGEDVIVGVVDSGINPEHPSFADDGSYTDPAALGWTGTCDNSTDPTFTCNNKLIGAKYFNETASSVGPLADYEIVSPRDVDGHGSHTASTAAGNVVAADYQGADAGIASGMAPRARVAAYKACWDLVDPDDSGCYYGDTMAAIEAAVEDGVDVINFSIGGSLTTLLTPPAQAFLDASIAGVYSVTSAGNDGPDVSTVGMPVPWVTNTAAATYEGFSLADAARVNTGTLADTVIEAPQGAYKPLDEEGITGELAIVTPLDACSAVTNPESIAGKFALLQRGGCNFTVKIANAEAAGASAVVVFNNVSDAPIPMAGDPAATVSAVMISLENGNTIMSDIDSGTAVSMTLSTAYKLPSEEHGNIMADFSSRGPNLAVADLMVPDITAPGVKILAAASQGDDFAYLQGTSMASPHIAGIGALLKQAHPDWSPAAIQSAIMTTARQNVVKEDESTPATPFDMGAGYVVPNSAVNPGLVYDAGIYDYLGFICGKANEAASVPNNYGISCGAFENAGYLGGADYNQPSITVSELGQPRSIIRYVTNVSGAAATFNATVEAPEGVDVNVLVYNGSSFVSASSMTIADGGLGIYAVTLSQNNPQLDAWKFGSISWSDGIHNARIPLSVKAVLPPQIEVVSELVYQADTERPRILIPVTTNYNGRLFANGHGMAEAEYNLGLVYQDEDQAFTFNEDSLGFNVMTVQPGTKAVRFALYTEQLPDAAMDLDLFVYACHEWSCTQVGTSTSVTSDESVTIVDPEALNDEAAGNVYIAFVHGYNLNGAPGVYYYLNEFHVADQENNLSVRASSIARDGGVTRVSFSMVNIEEGQHYLGGVSFENGEGQDIGFTLVEVNR
ncbi:S8 family serine peptidase [Neptunicella sp. SCSIO 80796]|uniref:S8 family serine peptidase n=1 Tax=Neptunicella plasticusilytica TaxID=3117012 RepID=UPI003A4E5B9D